MYSNSRIESFEQCPRKYKFRYVDNLRMDTEGIEAFVGKRVHESLEKLYRDLKLTKLNSLEDILAFYESQWEKNWHSDIRVVRTDFTPGHYFGLGRQCLSDYYKRYHPFDQTKTLGLEERIEFKLTEGTKTYALQGYIDRLSWHPGTEMYEIHDYKTGNSLPTQEEADQDRQLALYQLGLMQRWPDAKNIRLVWHYLVFDKTIVSTRTRADLETLEKEVLAVIHQIEAEAQVGRWDVRVSRLCEWCEYRPLCPAHKHPVEMEALTPNEYLQNTGVQLVQQYAALESQKNDHQAAIKMLESEQKQMEEAVVAYADREGLMTIDGPDYRLLVRSDDDWKVPRKAEDPFAWELLRTTLKNAGKLEDVSTVNGAMLKYAVKRNKWPEALVKSILGLIPRTTRKTVSLLKKS